MGSLQVAVTTLLGAATAWAFGVGWTAGLLLGGAVAMSSTAVVVKQLADQGELNKAPLANIGHGCLLGDARL